MAYTKIYKTLQIQTREQFTASEPEASMALMEFGAEETMRTPVLIPFHAVDHIVATKETREESRPDPLGCDDGGGSVVGECKTCEAALEH